MRLHKLVFIAAAAYSMAIGIGLFGYRLLVVLPELENAAIQLEARNLQAVKNTFEKKFNELSRLSFRWAKWDETYGFVVAGDPDYINRNILANSFNRYDIDSLAIVDQSGKLIYGSLKQNSDYHSVKQLADISDDLSIEQILSRDDQTGFISINNQPAYFSSHTIQDSESSYQEAGTLVFIRLIDGDFINDIKILSGFNLTFNTQQESPYQSKPLSVAPDFNITPNLHSESYKTSLLNPSGTIVTNMDLTGDPSRIPIFIDGATLVTIGALALLPLLLTIAIWIMFLVPIKKIFKKIRKMEKTGIISYIEYQSHILEVDLFINRFNALVDKIYSYQKDLKTETLTDGLTGIPNRRSFDKALDSSWRYSARNKTPFCVIMIDIDHFKSYNDHYGHQAGDDALKEVAATLNNYVRRSSDLLARYGGEEFSALIRPNNKQDLHDSLSVIQKAIEELNIEHGYSSSASAITISSGACLIENPGIWMKDKKDEALRSADQALYQAKKNGRNTFVINTLTSKN